jgi:hypothetical protein
MAHVTLNAAFKGFSKRIGRMVFYTCDGRTYVRSHVTPRDPKTPRQRELRAAFAKAVASWQALQEGEKAAWKGRRHRVRVKGYNAYLSAFMTHRWDIKGVGDPRPYRETAAPAPFQGRTKEHPSFILPRCAVVASPYQQANSLYADNLRL